MELIRFAVAVVALALLGNPSREGQPTAVPSTPPPGADDPAAYPIGDMQVREVVLCGERWREVYINDIYIGMAKAG